MAAIGGPLAQGLATSDPDAAASNASAPGAHFYTPAEANTLQRHSHGVDRWSVWMCNVPTKTPVSLTPQEAVNTLQKTVTPYFVWLSVNQYRPEFQAGGTVPVGTEEGDYMDTCVRQALDQQAGTGASNFDGLAVIEDTPTPTGVANSGLRCTDGSGCQVEPKGQNLKGRRYMWLGAGDVVDTTNYGPPPEFGPASISTVAHELGHALDWPHSSSGVFEFTVGNVAQWGNLLAQIPGATKAFLGHVGGIMARARPLAERYPTLSEEERKQLTTELQVLNLSIGFNQYDNPVDLMGAEGKTLSSSSTPPIIEPIAFDRYASGWIPASEAVVHPSGTRHVTLQPVGTTGTQIVFVPTDRPDTFVTLEARTSTDWFRTTQGLGVLVHVIDQAPAACGDETQPCVGEHRSQRSFPGAPNGVEHVLSVGGRLDLGGLHVSVTGRQGNGYLVTLSGGPIKLSPLAAPSGA